MLVAVSRTELLLEAECSACMLFKCFLGRLFAGRWVMNAISCQLAFVAGLRGEASAKCDVRSCAYSIHKQALNTT